MVVVGILADTHGILHPSVVPTLRAAGCARILHAGDVCDARYASRLKLPALLGSLREVAAVEAVRGNTDDKVAHMLPSVLTYREPRSDLRFIVHHGDLIDCHDDEAVLAALRPDGGWRARGDLVVYGHTHKPRFVRHPSGVHFLNPGSAGPKRFSLPIQLALVRCGGGDARPSFEVGRVDLEAGAAASAWRPAAADAAATPKPRRREAAPSNKRKRAAGGGAGA